MTEQTDAAEVEAAEELLACECGHSLDEHNGLGCYARITYTPTVVKCDCSLTDDRTYAELLAPRLAAREAAAEARGAQAVLAAVDYWGSDIGPAALRAARAAAAAGGGGEL